jgi:hypothetical protein
VNGTHIRCLNLQFWNKVVASQVVSGICKYMRQNLEILRLSTSHPESDQSLFSEALETAVHSAHKVMSGRPILRGLRELAVQRFDLSKLYQPLSILCDLNSLAELTISCCNNTIKFLSDVRSEVNGKALQMSHFALKSSGYEEGQWSKEMNEAACLGLRNLVTAPKLRSLHLSWDDESPLSDILLEVPLRAPNLRCLGFHDGRHMMHHETSHNSDNLHDVLKQCPKL